MHNPKIVSALVALGLTPNAIQLYEQSFLTGRTTVGRLAAVIGMDRSSAHLAAGQLRTFGLLNEEVVGERTYVWVKSPKDVLSRLKIQINHLQTQYDGVEESLPELSAGYQAAEKLPVVQVFTGRTGLKQVASNILGTTGGGDILLFTNQEFEREVFNASDHKDFIIARKQLGLKIRVLAVDTNEADELKKNDALNLRETRILHDETSIPFKSETYIYGNSVAMLSYSGQVFGFITRSRDFAEAQRWAFEKIWKVTRP
jgi:hypothetical protein